MPTATVATAATAADPLPLDDRTLLPPPPRSSPPAGGFAEAGADAPPPLLSTGALLGSVLDDLAARHRTAQGGGWTGGLRCGFPLIDRDLRGLRPRTVTILNAPPNVGKTTLCNQIAYNVAAFASQRAASFYVSFENDPADLILKHLARLSGWKMADLEGGRVSPGDRLLREAADRLASVPLFYLRGNAATTPQVITERAKEALAACERAGGGRAGTELLLCLDYLQYFARFFPGKGNTEQVGYALSALRALAEDTGAALLVIGSQNRETNKGSGGGGGGAAAMFGGRGSGEIEYDADTLLSLTPADGIAAAGRDGGRALRLTAAKTRFGGAGAECELTAYDDYARFDAPGAEVRG